ncbi:hypothetical protein [Tengunoibacter tsumagoiensis]|uniref:Uncharacterized protein n=1 Tax=Tengunoibacter tsumagoiensis TaxID=2014871 RepID=A0A402A541_9CHLR|nr:hypothetical protein [Tengunoibacter tsumagoiensis]GCE14213.1 hypothetical protein KTT_40720 [Tengunoibacter tsumagoiensis]GCE14267.1 hypothetical protein KTT_41260 [Tengunoibacter tsumagoiensis]
MKITITAIVRFAVSGFAATIQIQARNIDAVTLTIIHESMVETQAHDLIGCEVGSPISVTDRESVTMIARAEGRIIGSGIFEICTDMAESIGQLLVAQGLSNILIIQEEDQEDQEDQADQADQEHQATREKAQVL